MKSSANNSMQRTTLRAAADAERWARRTDRYETSNHGGKRE